MRWSNDMTVVTLFRVVEIFDLFDVSFFLSVDAMCVCTVPCLLSQNARFPERMQKREKRKGAGGDDPPASFWS